MPTPPRRRASHERPSTPTGTHSTATVTIGRTISPGDFANVSVKIEAECAPGESITDALERVSRLIDRRIPIEAKKARSWATDPGEIAPLEDFDSRGTPT